MALLYIGIGLLAFGIIGWILVIYIFRDNYDPSDDNGGWA